MADSSAQNQPNWQSFLNSDVPGLAKSQVLDNDNERALKHKSMAVPPPSDHSTDDPTSPSTPVPAVNSPYLAILCARWAAFTTFTVSNVLTVKLPAQPNFSPTI